QAEFYEPRRQASPSPRSDSPHGEPRSVSESIATAQPVRRKCRCRSLEGVRAYRYLRPLAEGEPTSMPAPTLFALGVWKYRNPTETRDRRMRSESGLSFHRSSIQIDTKNCTDRAPF